MGNFYYIRSYFDVFYPRYMLIFVLYLLFLPKPARFDIDFWKIWEKIFSTEIFQICDGVVQSFAKLSKSTLILHIFDEKWKLSLKMMFYCQKWLKICVFSSKIVQNLSPFPWGICAFFPWGMGNEIRVFSPYSPSCYSLGTTTSLNMEKRKWCS